jgi:hypothetical protein
MCTANNRVLNYTSVLSDDIKNKNSYDTLKEDMLYWMNDKILSKVTYLGFINRQHLY